ncbi:MAG: hypothetical protein A2583_00565 [Bdellovibrionales bacterium RIFOXYD1_FULL_53_11]|nr:MAG: hypothetical protein A2583_00565 [Bdellovibrionales bacterium RIFOXYD1_FULL_53_11]
MKSWKGFVRGVIVLLAFVVMVPVAGANVSLKNGNFFLNFIDIIYPGGFEPKIERAYNSMTPYKGIFGNNWGSEYEVFLNVSADGSVVVHEYGGGAENRFTPAQFNAQELDKAVDSLAAVAQKSGVAGSASQLAAYKQKLKGDATFRNDEWEKFRSQGRIKPRQLLVGTKLYSVKFNYQFITRFQDGYVRQFDNGRIEKFNDSGKIARISDKNNNFIDFTYGKDGKLQKVVDNFNRKIFFTFNTQGLVAKIQGENGKEASYKYNALKQLVYSKDVDNNVYTYSYDKIDNLTQIGYADKTTENITYYGPEKGYMVKKDKARDGTVTDYTYEKHGPGVSSVALDVKGPDGKTISSSKYEYHIKTRADGDEWTQKLVSVLDGEKTETVYSESNGLPLSIKKGGEETTFQYDAKGHVTRKASPLEVTELAYDDKAGKVSKVVIYAPGAKAQAKWSQFQYDAKGNLQFAKNSAGSAVKLFYDANGRIKSLVDQNKRRIDFKYNEHSKPVEISDPSLGTIKVSYTNSGEIKKVESASGRKVALQVTSAFQNLLDIIQPAGVSLSF